MRKIITFPGVLAAALILAAACGDDGGGEAAECKSTDTYLNYGEAFFKTNCTLCHGAMAATLGDGVKLDTQAAVQEHTSHIIEHAVELTPPIMPSGSPTGLPQADRDRLKAWLDCGAP